MSYHISEPKFVFLIDNFFAVFSSSFCHFFLCLNLCVCVTGPADRVALRRVQRGVEPVGGRRLSGYSPLRLGGQDRPPPPGAPHASGPSHKPQHNYSVPDPGSGAFLTPGSGSGMGKKSGSGSWMNNPDHEKIRIQDPGWKKFGSGIRNKHPGSATLHNYPFYLI